MTTESRHSENVFDQQTAKNDQEIRFRCPHCQKLYRTTADVFEGNNPEFDCAGCSQAFILRREINDFGLFVTAAPEKYKFEPCPKCSNLKPLHSDECPSCGVFASKYLELQKAESPMLYEINKLWQDVVTHFDEDRYHQDFLNRCHQHMALNLAFQKYAELQKTVGYDALCDKYIKQIELRMEQQLKSPRFNKNVSDPLVVQEDLGLGQIVFILIGALGMLLLIYNKFYPTFPNFNGMVLGLTIGSFAIGLFYNPTGPVKS